VPGVTGAGPLFFLPENPDIVPSRTRGAPFRGRAIPSLNFGSGIANLSLLDRLGGLC